MSDELGTKIYLIFQSIHNVMLAEELLIQDDIQIEMVPVPREISSDCGMSLTCAADDLNSVKTCLAKGTFTTPFKIYGL